MTTVGECPGSGAAVEIEKLEKIIFAVVLINRGKLWTHVG